MSAEGKPALLLEGYSLFIEVSNIFCIFPFSSVVFSTEIPGDEEYTIQDYIDGMYARYSA